MALNYEMMLPLQFSIEENITNRSNTVTGHIVMFCRIEKIHRTTRLPKNAYQHQRKKFR